MEYIDLTTYLNDIMKRFYPIGVEEDGGVTRLGYTREEDLMHEEFVRIAKEEGYLVETDEVGNTFISIKNYDEYYLIGSHLDSVINGGRYDGVIGVAVGLILLKLIEEDNLDIPLKVAAFRCEESSNFMKSTLGSGLITGESYDFDSLVSQKGKKLSEIFQNRGLNEKPELIKGIKAYLELHIEQGRILENKDLKIGIVDAIAGNIRLKARIKGLAEHSGATPMSLRKDALCAAGEIITAIESIGKNYKSGTAVTTVGMIGNYPNSVNVIPGEVEFSVDIRDKSTKSMYDIKVEIEELIEEVCNRRCLSYDIKLVSNADSVVLDENLRRDLSKAAKDLGINHIIMSSGAGHDAMKFTKLTKAGLIFIPCNDGISHNPEEYAEIEDAVCGAMIILEYLKEAAK
ncbi:MAG TPA: M20 family metallo-hydrolase [Tissierellaceae bacterium]|nr:M20 family metallo-hydrolase [Tissierellaceae bacterium]